MKEVCGKFLTLLVLAGIFSTQSLDLDADMCLNGQHPEKCCYETYCPANGDGSFLPTNMTGKIYDSVSFTKGFMPEVTNNEIACFHFEILFYISCPQAAPVPDVARSGASAFLASVSTETAGSRGSGARRTRSAPSPGRWRSAG